MRPLAILLLASLAFAGKPDMEKERRPINANLENVDAATTAKMLKKAVKLKLEFAPQIADRRINVRLISVPTVTAMKDIADAFDCEVQFLGKKRWRLAPAWQMTILNVIESKKVSGLKVDKMSIEQFLALVRSETKLDVTLDPAVNRTRIVTLRASKITWRRLLDKFVKAHELQWELRYGVIYIATPLRFEKMPVLPPQLQSAALQKLRLPVSFESASLDKIGATLALVTGVRFELPQKAKARTVSAKAKDVTLEQALALMLYPLDLTAVEKDGAVHVQPLVSK